MANTIISAQLEHNRREEALADKANRIAAGILWILVMVGMSAGFAATGWTMNQCVLHIPHWQLYLLIIAGIIQFVFSIYALFRGLDDLFFRKDDRRRITRRKGDH